MRSCGKSGRCALKCGFWLTVVLVLAACRVDNNAALRVGANIWPGYEPLQLARHAGFYNEHDIVLVDFPSSVEVMRAYRNGVIDVAALTADEALTIAATEPGMHKIVLLADMSEGGDCIVAQPWIASFADLNGRRIGVESNALGAYVLLRALQVHGMTASAVTPITLPYEQHEQAFRGGRVDAVVTFEPRCARLTAVGARKLFTSREIPGEIADVLLTRTNLIETRSATLKQLVRSWFAAVEELRRDPNAAAELAAPHQGVAPTTFLTSLEGVKLVSRDENLRLLTAANGLDATLDRLSEVMLAHGLLTSQVDSKSMLESRIVAQAQP